MDIRNIQSPIHYLSVFVWKDGGTIGYLLPEISSICLTQCTLLVSPKRSEDQEVDHLRLLVCKDGGTRNIKYLITSVYCTCQSKKTTNQIHYLSVLFLLVKKDPEDQEVDHLSVLVCEDMVVPGVGADQAAKISKTFGLKSDL